MARRGVQLPGGRPGRGWTRGAAVGAAVVGGPDPDPAVVGQLYVQDGRTDTKIAVLLSISRAPRTTPDSRPGKLNRFRDLAQLREPPAPSWY